MQTIVKISATATTVNIESQDFSSNINQTAISELPINGRRWSNFAILAPGSVPDGSFGLISFRGISGLLNNYDQQKRDFPGLGIFSAPDYLNTVNRTALTGSTRSLTDAQIDDVLGFLNSLTGTVPRRGDQRLMLPKIDWQID